jgi:hypothetical protein
MKGLASVLGFVLLTMVCWGIYGPVLTKGQVDMHSGLRPFICVGLAYFVIAVAVPIALLKTTGEKGHWSATGLFWSLLAGVVTAIGALGIILAIGARGSPLYVMPLVFGIAPVVNSFVTIHFSRAYKQIGPVFIAGLILVMLGAVTVLVFAPQKESATVSTKNGVKVTIVAKMSDGADKTTELAAPSMADFEKQFPDAYRKYFPLSISEWCLVLLYTLMTAVCWGIYGPTLHRGQMAMAGSRLRPLLCVGMAYFLIAVLVPLFLLTISPDRGEWTTAGALWSLAAGTAGAVGALGIIMAFNYGGKPVYVMPLVFGGAPVVNTLFVLALSSTIDRIGPVFIAGMILVAAGAVTVLIFAPRAPAHAPVQGAESQDAKKDKEPARLAPGE